MRRLPWSVFCVSHDSQRRDDSDEMTHGELAAEYVASLYGRLFDLDDVNFQQLQYACRWHTQGGISSDPTIGACWDADRLDLTRVGIVPNPDLMSTEPGKEMAATRSDLWSERELEALLEDARKEILLNSNGWNRMDKLLDYCPMLKPYGLGKRIIRYGQWLKLLGENWTSCDVISPYGRTLKSVLE